MPALNRTSRFVLARAAVLVGACSQEPLDTHHDDASSLARQTSQALTCPAGNGFYALYYGTADSDIAKLRAARPNFVVVANESAAWPDKYHYDNPADHTGPTGIKVIAYVPMNYAKADRCAGNQTTTSCTNLSCKGDCVTCQGDCTCVPIQTRIADAMSRGYDGVFFDETDSANDAYNADCYSRVKAAGSDKLVMVNPGAVPQSASIFEAADIVSVENKYTAQLGAAFPSVAPERWLAVQGDPAEQAAVSLGDAKARLDTFRDNGGFWYYSSTPHWKLPDWFDDFASWVKTQGDVACEPPQPTSQLSSWGAWNDASSVHYRYDFAQPFLRYRVYIDSDNLADTGFQRAGIGADYMVEGSSLYKHLGGGWSWERKGSAGQVLTATSTAWTVPRSMLLATSYPNQHALVFEAETSAGAFDPTSPYQHVFSDASGAIVGPFARNDAQSVVYEATFSQPYDYHHVFIDVDSSSASGYGYRGIGADYMLENDRLHRHSGSGWSWTPVADAPALVDAAGRRTWQLPRALLGAHGTSGDPARVVFHGKGASEYAAPIYLQTYTR